MGYTIFGDMKFGFYDFGVCHIWWLRLWIIRHLGYAPVGGYDSVSKTCLGARVKKRVLERVLPSAMHIQVIQSETLGKLLVKQSSSVLPRVSDWIICMTLGKILSETRFFTWGDFNVKYVLVKRYGPS